MFYFLILICSQIILESFPVSSSGHVVFLENFLDYFSCESSLSLASDKVLSHLLHGPTIFILAIFFFERWFFLLKNFKRCWLYIFKIIVFVLIADIVTFFLYLFYNYSGFAKSLHCFPVGLGFLLSLLFLFSLKFCTHNKKSFLTWQKALVIGFSQGISLFPGISRFGLTFVVGRWLGLPARKSFEFSFAIQWPLIFAGFLEGVVKICFCKYTISFEALSAIDIFFLLFSVIFSSVIAFFAIKLARFMVLTHKLWYFSFFLSFSFILWLIFVYIVL